MVDVHAHVVPTGDDGAQSIEEGLELCREASRHGTRILYATPHVHARWDSYPLTAERLASTTRRSRCSASGAGRSGSTCGGASRSTRARYPQPPTCATTGCTGATAT